jgi:xanthine/uracil permease
MISTSFSSPVFGSVTLSIYGSIGVSVHSFLYNSPFSNLNLIPLSVKYFVSVFLSCLGSLGAFPNGLVVILPSLILDGWGLITY